MTKPSAEQHDRPYGPTGGDALFSETIGVLRGLHGPALGALSVERLVVGVFFVGVKLSDGSGGVAYTPPECISRAANQILKGKRLIYRGMPVTTILDGEIAGPFAPVIRLATLNALSSRFLADGRYPHRDADLGDNPALFNGRRVCLVGAIIPLLRRIREYHPAEVLIIDKKEATRNEAGAIRGRFVPPERTAETLAACDTVILTGATVANQSFVELARQVPDSSFLAVVGPTAGFVPDALFARKVAMVGTVLVTDSDQALEILAEGGGGYRLFGDCVKKINLFNPHRLQELGLLSQF